MYNVPIIKSSLRIRAVALNKAHKPSHQTPWYWSAGAGWPSVWSQTEAGISIAPYGFRGLGDLLLYFEITQQSFGNPYSLNGVPTNLAVAIWPNNGQGGFNNAFMLYMSLDHADQFWYYLMKNFGTTGLLTDAPLLSASAARKLGVNYVGIGSSPWGPDQWLPGMVSPLVTPIV